MPSNIRVEREVSQEEEGAVKKLDDLRIREQGLGRENLSRQSSHTEGAESIISSGHSGSFQQQRSHEADGNDRKQKEVQDTNREDIDDSQKDKFEQEHGGVDGVTSRQTSGFEEPGSGEKRKGKKYENFS